MNGEPVFNLSISIDEAFANPRAISLRTRLDLDTNRRILRVSDMRANYCRMFSMFADWANSMVARLELSEDDRKKLCMNQLVQIACLWFNYKSFKHGHNGLVQTGGTFLPFDEWRLQQEVEPEMIAIMNSSLLIARTQVQPKFRALELDDVEFALLKALIFCSCGLVETLSPEGINELRSARLRIQEALVQYESGRIPQYRRGPRGPLPSPETVAFRITHILSLMNDFSMYTTVAEAATTQVVSLNIGEMRGEISYDMHLRS